MVGREKEIADLLGLLKNPQVGLITLHGFGGTGKTRLAVEVGRAALEMFADGVWFVALAPLDSPDYIFTATAAAIGFSFHGSEDPKSQLLHFLSGKNLFIIFDNLEHLLPAGTNHFEELLQNAPGIRLLVTSRHPINAPWEWVYPLHGLDYEVSPLVTDGEIPAAIQLFLQHLSRVGAPASDNDPACAAQICQIVKGLPLALLLAASWGRALGCDEIFYEIRRGIGFMHAWQQTFPEKHSSMQAVFEYSWKLLSPHKQSVLRKLAVFRGGFDRTAAAEVAGAHLPLLADLVDQSLIERVSNDRYQIHELLRQYLHDHLVSAGEERSTRDQHLAYYVQLAEQAEPELRGRLQRAWLTRLGMEVDNIRAALDWVLASRETTNLERGLHMMDCLQRFWNWHLYLRDGYGYLMQLLENQSSLPSDDSLTYAHGRGLNLAASLSFLLAELTTTRRLANEALKIGIELDDPRLIGDSYFCQGVEACYRTEFAIAHTFLERAIEQYQQIDYSPGLSEAMNALGRVHLFQKDFSASFSKLSTALDLATKQGDVRDINTSLYFLGQLGILDPQIGLLRARNYSEEALQSARELEDKSFVGLILFNLGEIARSEGDMEQAAVFFEEADSIARELGSKYESIEIQSILGIIYLRLGKFDQSQQMIWNSFVQAQLAKDLKWVLPTCLLGWAGWMVSKGQAQLGATILGALENQELLNLWPAQRTEYERIYASAKAQLTEKQFKQFYKEGQALSITEAVQLVQNQEFKEQGRDIERLNQLTKREIEILRLVAQGLSDAQVAERLVLSPRTVNAHLTSIYNKLGVNSRSAATRYALEHGLA